MTSRIHDLYLDTKGITAEELESFMTFYAEAQRACNWVLGDGAIAAKRVHGEDNYSQAFPVWASHEHMLRCEMVSRAYPPKDRNILATWSVHMGVSKKEDRIKRVQAHVDAGRTSDEARKANQEERQEGKRKSWLLAIDVNYYIHRKYPKNGVDTADYVTKWIQQVVEDLKRKGLTDCVCCFDSPNNHRKSLTVDWEHKYKASRKSKPTELIQQLVMVRELLECVGFACVSVVGCEGDDCLASYAKQFPGKVAILTVDKDLKQCLSGTDIAMIEDVVWKDDEFTGERIVEYSWYTEEPHKRLECRNLFDDTGLTPKQFIEFQMLMGDSADNIKGAIGVGDVIALNLLNIFQTADDSVEAAKAGDERILSMRTGKVILKALVDFESRLEITRKLVTLKTNV